MKGRNRKAIQKIASKVSLNIVALHSVSMAVYYDRLRTILCEPRSLEHKVRPLTLEAT